MQGDSVILFRLRPTALPGGCYECEPAPTDIEGKLTKVSIPKETAPGERRVAVVPESVGRLAAMDLEVVVESGAGEAAFFADSDYEAAGASIEPDAAAVFGDAELMVKVNAPTVDASAGRCEVDLLRAGSALAAVLAPRDNPQLVRGIAEAGVTACALDMVPRLSRAQAMDVLTSMSTVAGYRAVLLACEAMPKMVPMMMTPAGTLRPAKGLVIGAGVAGLEAIATARRLGAVVKAVDTRPAAQEQVESLGAKFVVMEVGAEEAEDAGGYARDLGEEFYSRQQEVLAPHVEEADFIIATAVIPGRRAPLLITEGMVRAMKPGSVIVDLAAPSGGNCQLTEPGTRTERHGVTLFGPLNLPGEVPVHASQMFSRNVAAFIAELIGDGRINIDMENEIIRETLITRDGEVVHQALKEPPQGKED